MLFNRFRNAHFFVNFTFIPSSLNQSHIRFLNQHYAYIMSIKECSACLVFFVHSLKQVLLFFFIFRNKNTYTYIHFPVLLYIHFCRDDQLDQYWPLHIYIPVLGAASHREWEMYINILWGVWTSTSQYRSPNNKQGNAYRVSQVCLTIKYLYIYVSEILLCVMFVNIYIYIYSTISMYFSFHFHCFVLATNGSWLSWLGRCSQSQICLRVYIRVEGI